MTDALNSLPETRRRILEQIKRGGNTTADAIAGGPEQQLVTVVLTSPATSGSGEHTEEWRSGLRSALGPMGMLVEWLADGSLVTVVARTSSAQDQAIVAARAALILKERCPEARIAVAMLRTRIIKENATMHVMAFARPSPVTGMSRARKASVGMV